jgi:hypothetical protein
MVLQEQKLTARVDDNEKKKEDEATKTVKPKDAREEKVDMVSSI